MTKTNVCVAMLITSVGLFGCDKLMSKLKKDADAGSDASAVAAADTSTADAAAAAPDTAPSASAAADNTPFVPPGSCVDPVKDAKKRMPEMGEATVDDIQDLDGDGKKDKTVAFMGMGMNWPFEIYVMRGTCGHWVGEINGKGVTETNLRSKGLKSLSTMVANPCTEPCGCTNTDISYYFNGKTYVAGKSKEVAFNDPCDAGAKGASAADAGKPSAAGPYKLGDKVDVEWKGKNWPATIIGVPAKDKYKIHYDGWEAKWDEVVGPSRIKGRR